MKHKTKFGIYFVFIMGMLLMLAGSCKKKSSTDSTISTVTDIDGNVYHTVSIGSQVWMAENLKVVRYRNGDAIPYVINDVLWTGLSTGAYSNYNNDVSMANVYGRLYNFYTVTDPRKISPAGWHVPTENDWTLLIAFLGGETIAGGKLKETGTTHWVAPNQGATNQSGFSAIPGGMRSKTNGSYAEIGIAGFFWSSTSDAAGDGWGHQLGSVKESIFSGTFPTTYGFSVRCIRD